MGSHKLNSALPQAYYAKMEGTTNITTETGAGQWGAALSYAARLFGLEAAVYQVIQSACESEATEKPFKKLVKRLAAHHKQPHAKHSRGYVAYIDDVDRHRPDKKAQPCGRSRAEQNPYNS